jgi:putative transposase
MRKPQFINERIYHIYNRGVEKRDIFMDIKDYFRFIHDLFEFNDKEPAGKYFKMNVNNVARKRNLLVEILSYCLMPNHFHLLLRQIANNGITNFMKKLGTGYTMYFNEKYDRVGSLFQGPFKAVFLDDEDYLIYLPFYIHANCVDLILPNWKENGISNFEQIKAYLKKYRWSSHLEYCDVKNFPSIMTKSLRDMIWQTPERYQKQFEEWLESRNLKKIQNIIIE